MQNKQNLSQKIEEYSKTDAQKYIEITTVGNFFEDMGILTRQGDLKLKQIIQLYSNPIEQYYDVFREYIKEHKNEKAYEHFEWWAKKVKK